MLCNVQRWDFPEAGFHDLDFRLERVLCDHRDGRDFYKTIPVGMPEIKPTLERCVFYTYGINPKTSERMGPGGSGVIVSRRPNDRGPLHFYAVTNWHVAKQRGYSFIRVNTKDGESRCLEYDPDQWVHDPEGDDLAIIDITDDLDLNTDEVSHVEESIFLTDDFIKNFDVRYGEDVFMLGLLADSPGKNQNSPVCRFGNLARLADVRSPIEQPNGTIRQTHLTDMRSRTGYSGSPVFVYRTPSAYVGDDWHEGTAIWNYFLRLLGIHCGQFPETISVERAEAIGDIIREGDDIYSPSAMNMVIPAPSISALLDHPSLEERRKMREKDRKGGASRMVVPEAASPEPPTTDENPRHKEDFNSLLDAAVKSPKSDD